MRHYILEKSHACLAALQQPASDAPFAILSETVAESLEILAPDSIAASRLKLADAAFRGQKVSVDRHG
jgi:hypothetical protein